MSRSGGMVEEVVSLERWRGSTWLLTKAGHSRVAVDVGELRVSKQKLARGACFNADDALSRGLRRGGWIGVIGSFFPGFYHSSLTSYVLRPQQVAVYITLKTCNIESRILSSLPPCLSTGYRRSSHNQPPPGGKMIHNTETTRSFKDSRNHCLQNCLN